MLTGASPPRRQSFDEIQVHRIDVVEPNGTLRMVISNKNRLPPVIVNGKEHPEMGEPRPQAGMLFYNDEGSENGGLIFGGHRNEPASTTTPTASRALQSATKTGVFGWEEQTTEARLLR
jgi:hypothetical protein